MDPEEEETKALCALCDGGGLLLQETTIGHHGLRCWLCKGSGVVTIEEIARWGKAGKPSSKPEGWDIIT